MKACTTMVMATCLLCSGVSPAEVIETYSFDGGFGMHRIVHEINTAIFVGDQWGDNPISPPILDITVGIQDVGKTFIANRDNDPNFAAFVAFATDGIDDSMIMPILFTSDDPSKWDIWMSICDGNGHDLQGYRIDSISATVEYLTIDIPGENGQHDGIWTDFYLTVDYRIEGVAIPEPATIVLLGLGTITLVRRQRQYKQ